MIELTALTKLYGEKTAVDNLSFSVRPGRVTGFLGPNGAGKSTTMRMIVGLDVPTSGQAIINGKPYAQLKAPLREVGTLLEAKAVHTSRSATNHLLALATTHGFSRTRVDQVIELVGLQDVAGKRAGGFSLGMGQRLGIAAALLGDPATVMLDEPVNGLDPEGIRWVRDLLRGLADRGPYGVRLQPPDERDGRDSRPSHRDRPRPAARRHEHERSSSRPTRPPAYG